MPRGGRGSVTRRSSPWQRTRDHRRPRRRSRRHPTQKGRTDSEFHCRTQFFHIKLKHFYGLLLSYLRGCGTLNFRQSLFNNHRSKGLHRRARAEIRRSALAPTRKPAEARASGWMTLRRRGATTMIRRRRRRRPRRLGSCCRTRPPCCTSAFRSYPCSLSSCSTYFVEQGICATRCNVNTIQYVSQLKSTALAN